MIRRVGALAAALLVVLGPVGSGHPAGAQDDADTGGAALELADQTAIVRAGELFSIAFEADDLPPDAPLTVRLHDRVRTRSELDRVIAGSGLRGARSTVQLDLGGIPRRADGVLELSLATDSGPGALALGVPGVYPLTLTSEDADGDTVRLVSQLVVPPAVDDESPPLGVALIAELALDPVRGTELPPRLHQGALRELAGLVTTLQLAPGVPITIAPRPETLVALALSQDDVGLAVLQQIQALTAEHTLLGGPFVPVSPEALAGELSVELGRQLSVGDAVVRSVFTGSEPDTTTWLAQSGMGRAGLRLLTTAGIERVVLPADQVESSADGVLTLARPFQLVPQRTRNDTGRAVAVGAMILDRPVEERLASDAEPAAVGVQVVAELAALYFEQPTVARAAILRVDRSTPPMAIATIERALAQGGFLRPVPVATAFDESEPAVTGRTTPREIELADDPDVEAISAATADSVRAARGQLASLGTMLAEADPALQAAEADVLRAEAEQASSGERQAHLRDARTRIGAIVGGVSTAGTSTVTLTARSGSVPFTFVNDTGSPLSVVLHLRSAKLEVPGGTDVPLELPVGATRVNIDIRTRASGSIPLEAVLTSPDGALLLTTARYSVQSTAVSGVGVVLSAGAMLFLLVWWGRHWREHRRATKLVAPEEAEALAASAASE